MREAEGAVAKLFADVTRFFQPNILCCSPYFVGEQTLSIYPKYGRL